MKAIRFGLALAVSALMATAAAAQQPLKIGLITTLSGPAGYLGADIRDAFQLALEMEGGKLGGVPFNSWSKKTVSSPARASRSRTGCMKTERIKLFTGIIFSNVAGAVVPDILDGGRHLCQPQCRPVEFRRRGLPQELFRRVVAKRHPARKRRENATNLGYKKAFILAPNYQAGKDALDRASSATSRVRSSAKSILASTRPISRPRWRKSVPPSPT